MLPNPITPIRMVPPGVPNALAEPLSARRGEAYSGRNSSAGDLGGRDMGLREHVICDSDLHVMEPPDLWERYIDPAYRHAAPRGLAEIPGTCGCGSRTAWCSAWAPRVRCTSTAARRGGRQDHDTVYAESEARGWDPASQVDAMDAEGLDLAVLYPSRGLFVLGIDSSEQIGGDGLEPEFATAIARAYNDWLKDFCDHAPDRMFGAGMVAPHDVPGAVVEARRCVEELGFKAIFLAPAAVNRRPWHHPAYDPLWEEIQRLGVPRGLPRRRPDLPHTRLRRSRCLTA